MCVLRGALGSLSSCQVRQQEAGFYRTRRKPRNAIKALVSQIRKLRYRLLINTSVVPQVELAICKMSLGRVTEIGGRDTVNHLINPCTSLSVVAMATVIKKNLLN